MSSSRSQSPAPSRQPPSTPRQSSRRPSTQPTRSKQQHHHPGQQQQQQIRTLLSPPRSPKVDSPPPASASPRHSLVPTTQVDHAKLDDNKRRRRHKQNRAETPLKHEASLSSSDDSAPVQAPATTTVDSSAATPSKSARRRRGKSTRQPSPPPHDGTELEHPAPVFPSTTPPKTDLGALAHHSRSVPPDPFLQAPRLDAAWDMPAVAASGTDSPKQNLSWQQELLRSGSTRSATRGDSPVARPRSRGVSSNAKDSRSNAQAASAAKSRPALHTSHSESGTTGAGPSLNWQQELLLSMDPAGTVQQQPSQAQQQQQLGAPAGTTPARQRRNQIKDSITFGLSSVDLSEDDTDVFASPGSRRGGHAGASRGGRSAQPASAPTSFSTPSKAQQQQAAPASLVEPRYAGPTFHNSPAPSSLPMPSFMLRRKVDVAV
ncbi:hypothetical protein JCM3775_006478 [Rhodotorula graminis]